MKAPGLDRSTFGVKVALDTSDHMLAVHFHVDLRAHGFGVVFTHDFRRGREHALSDLLPLHPA